MCNQANRRSNGQRVAGGERAPPGRQPGLERVLGVRALDVPCLGRLRQAQSRGGGPRRRHASMAPSLALASRAPPKPWLASSCLPLAPERARHWLERSEAGHRLEAHLFTVTFQRLRHEKIGSVAALLMAYRKVFGLACEALSLSFAQAVELAQRAERCEQDTRPWLSTATCARCRCLRIALLQGQPLACPYCALLPTQGEIEHRAAPTSLCFEPT